MDHINLLSDLNDDMHTQAEHLRTAARRLATGEDAFDPKLPDQANGVLARASDLHSAAVSYFNITQDAARRTYSATLTVGGAELERRSYVPYGVIDWSGPDVHGFYVTVTLFVDGKWKCKVDDAATDEGGSEAWAVADTAEAAYTSALARLNLSNSNACTNRQGHP